MANSRAGRPPSTMTIESAGLAMKVYDIEPEGDVRGAVVVVQEAFGVNGQIEDVCRRFAAAGFRAVAPHLFHRTGDAVVTYADAGHGFHCDARDSYHKASATDAWRRTLDWFAVHLAAT